MKILNLAIIFVISASCSLLDHRDYEDQMLDEFTQTMFEPEKDFPLTAGDTGIVFMTDSELKGRTPASFEERKDDMFSITLQNELLMLENSLDEIEAQKYVIVRNKLGGESNRIYYLRLHPDQRSAYLMNRGIHPSDTYEYGQPLPSGPAIGLGMDKSAVISSWGRPVNIEVDGDPRDENERWSYVRRGKMKYLYFENGRVQGWSN